MFRVYSTALLFSGSSPRRALPTETKVESGTSQSKSGICVNLGNSGDLQRVKPVARTDVGQPWLVGKDRESLHREIIVERNPNNSQVARTMQDCRAKCLTPAMADLGDCEGVYANVT